MSERLTIEQLAAATGLTVRNIREHQTRGLLPPPVLEGRKGSYDGRHIARLRFIQQLQREGLNLQAIHWLLERAPAEATNEVVRFERALFASWSDEKPVHRTTEQLRADLQLHDDDDAVVQRAIDLQLLRPVGPDRWEVPSPRLLEAGADLRGLGIPISAALDVVEDLREHTGATARSFVMLFVTHVWEPFERQGRPPERWEDVRHALERLRAVATQALLAVFQQTMGATIDKAAATAALDSWQEPA